MSESTPRSGVVVGIDGSAASRSAVRWAAAEAAMRHVPLSIVLVAAPPAVEAVEFMSAAELADIQQKQDSEARRIIADAVDVASSLHGRSPEVDGEILRGHPARTLIDLSKEARMVVVGSGGRGVLERILLGSVSTAVVHHAHCPVAVIHDHAPTSSRMNQLPVLVGIDGSPASELATAIAFDEASWRGVELIALHAWSEAMFFPLAIPVPSSALRVEAEQTLAERLAGYRERYPDVTVKPLLVADNPVRRLLEEAESVQLVVVGSHGRGGFAGMLLGSVSTAVVQAAKTAVIVARTR